MLDCGGGKRNKNPINEVGEGESLGCRDNWTHDWGVKMKWRDGFVNLGFLSKMLEELCYVQEVSSK